MFSAEFRELMATLADEEYRREFVSENITTGIAFQIRHLRDSRGWTQSELAERIPKAQQEAISQWENPNYGRYSVNTLKKLAGAFDVGLLVKFAPFSELADWVINLTPERLAPPSFSAEIEQSFTSQLTSPLVVGASETSVAPKPVSDLMKALATAVDSATEVRAPARTDKESEKLIYEAA